MTQSVASLLYPKVYAGMGGWRRTMECRWSVGESSEISIESLIKLKMIVMSSEISIETLIKVKSGGGVLEGHLILWCRTLFCIRTATA